MGFEAHEAGSDVPTMIRVHSAAADLSPSLVSTAAEAHPARSPCAFAEAVEQCHLIRLSHITGKKIAHGRLSFCASFVSGSHCTRRSGRSFIDSRISWHRRAVSVCATFQNWRLTNVLFCGFPSQGDGYPGTVTRGRRLELFKVQCSKFKVQVLY